MKAVWTASSDSHYCRRLGIRLSAQCKSGKAELERRLLADDPIWLEGMTFTREKQWHNGHFRRGMAFRSFKLAG